MDSTLKLLRQKRESAEMEARNICSRLAKMDIANLPSRTKHTLYAIERMYREQAEILDSAIRNMQAQ